MREVIVLDFCLHLHVVLVVVKHGWRCSTACAFKLSRVVLHLVQEAFVPLWRRHIALSLARESWVGIPTYFQAAWAHRHLWRRVKAISRILHPRCISSRCLRTSLVLFLHASQKHALKASPISCFILKSILELVKATLKPCHVTDECFLIALHYLDFQWLSLLVLINKKLTKPDKSQIDCVLKIGEFQSQWLRAFVRCLAHVSQLVCVVLFRDPFKSQCFVVVLELLELSYHELLKLVLLIFTLFNESWVIFLRFSSRLTIVVCDDYVLDLADQRFLFKADFLLKVC